MAFGLKASKISELIIDTDADFKGYGIKNVKLLSELAVETNVDVKTHIVKNIKAVGLNNTPYYFTPLNTIERRVRKSGADWDGVDCLAWSPDGKYTAITSYYADAVEVAEFTGNDLVRKVRKTGADWNGATRVAWSDRKSVV